MKKINLLFLLTSLFTITSNFAQEKIILKGKELFGDIKARHIGPALMSGRITDLVMHPTNNKTIYTATAGGGVWKSGNGGASFAPIFDEHIQSIGCIAIDPSKPDQIFGLERVKHGLVIVCQLVMEFINLPMEDKTGKIWVYQNQTESVLLLLILPIVMWFGLAF